MGRHQVDAHELLGVQNLSLLTSCPSGEKFSRVGESKISLSALLCVVGLHVCTLVQTSSVYLRLLRLLHSATILCLTLLKTFPETWYSFPQLRTPFRTYPVSDGYAVFFFLPEF